jgi:phosphoglycolate phosphatase-like HAD superfamily hydrolase
MGAVLPQAIALDFDGVICNGLKEYFQTSLQVYRQIWPGSDEDRNREWENSFGRLRPVVETGWEMPLVLRAMAQGISEGDILKNWPQIRDRIMVQEQLDRVWLGQKVDTFRDRWIADDLSSWLRLHEFYPGVSAQLRHWIDREFPVFIITTKESRFVQALLEQEGLSLPATVIFGKDYQQPKANTLRELQGKGFEHLWFVEDRLATLQGIQKQPDLQKVGLFLADWGYNTKGDRTTTLADSQIDLLSLTQFGQPFEHWRMN